MVLKIDFMEVVKLKPVLKDYLWGGNKLVNYHKLSSGELIAESWELSFFPNSESLIDSGKDKGMKLSEVVNEKDLGLNVKKYPFFPLLIKLIDAEKDLSIQVHPSDEYALKNEKSFGKTEMWYVLEADEGAFLHIGFSKDVSKEEVSERINNNSITDIMNHIKVQPGDCYLIPSGTIHAIGKGCVVLEIQENSNLTYRVYDYGRKDKNGKPRELHIEKALEVLDFKRYLPINRKDKNPLMDINYFSVSKLVNPSIIEAKEDSFVCVTVIDGSGMIDGLMFQKGDSFFIPSLNKAKIEGACTLIMSKVN